ncbi:MAG: response regulator [Bacteroidota bacterium]
MGEGFAKILILDDDASIRALLRDILEPYFDLIIYGDGLTALAWMASGNIPDLIITDLNMPHLSGVELLKTIRESGVFRHVPVIVLSVVSDEEVQKNCFLLGANNFMSKPFNPEVLRKNILHTLSSPGRV